MPVTPITQAALINIACNSGPRCGAACAIGGRPMARNKGSSIRRADQAHTAGRPRHVSRGPQGWRPVTVEVVPRSASVSSYTAEPNGSQSILPPRYQDTGVQVSAAPIVTWTTTLWPTCSRDAARHFPIAAVYLFGLGGWLIAHGIWSLADRDPPPVFPTISADAEHVALHVLGSF